MAMLATVATGQDIFPNDIADLLGNQYYDSTSIATLDPIVGKHYGFDVEVVNTSGVEDTKTKMRDYLKKGYMIHFTGRGCYPGFIYASGGCTKGHVIGLFDIDDNDIVTQANSGMGEVHQKASLDDMANALNFGVFTAIKGGNGSKNNCNNLCNNKNSSVGADGLTEEQAQKVAHYYNTQHKPRGCCGLTNCVEFSNFFVSELTTKGTPGGYSVSGDGREVAPNLIANGQAEGGTEPRVWAVFSKTSGNHTGVVVGANEHDACDRIYPLVRMRKFNIVFGYLNILSGGMYMKSSDLRNVVLLGHGGMGKTSLAEAMLYNAGAIDRLGRVSDGNTVLDCDPEEVKRKASVSLATAPFDWRGSTVNIIDTPGYFDFAGEMLEAVSVVDSAVIVVSSTMTVGTEKAWAESCGIGKGKNRHPVDHPSDSMIRRVRRAE